MGNKCVYCPSLRMVDLFILSRGLLFENKDLCSRPSDEDVKWRSRRQESHPLPGSLNTSREEKRLLSIVKRFERCKAF